MAICIIMQLATQYDQLFILIGSLVKYYQLILQGFTIYGEVLKAPRNLKGWAANLKSMHNKNDLHNTSVFTALQLTGNNTLSLFLTWLPKLLSLYLIVYGLNAIA